MSNSRKFDQFYTHPSIAASFIVEVGKHFPLCNYDIILEPSAGCGNILDQLDLNNRLGYDIDPKRNDIEQRDFFDVEPFDFMGKEVMVVGNPPFGAQSKLAVAFFNHAALFAKTIAFIIPITWTKWSVQRRLDKRFKLIHSKELIHEAFVLDGEPYKVRCVQQIWTIEDTNCKDLRIREKPITTHNDFNFLHNRDTDKADFLLVVCGARKQHIHEINSTISYKTVERIRCNEPHVRRIFEFIDWTKHHNNSTGSMWINRETIIKEYTAAISYLLSR